MENLPQQNGDMPTPNADTPQKSIKSKYLSIDEQIVKMKLAFSNAKLPNILSQLKTLGYTEEKLNGLLEKVTDLEALHQKQKKEYGEQYAETQKLEQKRKEIHEMYMRHLAFCKILFKGNVQAGAILEFAGDRKQAYGAWWQQVSNFYSQLLANNELKTKAETINIKEADINAQKTALEELVALKESQKKEAGEAQQATENRDKALDELQPLYAELIAYAKILFQDSQELEALGVVVKR